MILALALTACDAPDVSPRWLAGVAFVSLVCAIRIVIVSKRDPR